MAEELQILAAYPLNGYRIGHLRQCCAASLRPEQMEITSAVVDAALNRRGDSHPQ